jgi:hypothetical protein
MRRRKDKKQTDERSRKRSKGVEERETGEREEDGR